MKRLAFFIVMVGLVGLLCLPVGKTHAIQILYEATDLADTPDGDLWQ